MGTWKSDCFDSSGAKTTAKTKLCLLMSYMGVVSSQVLGFLAATISGIALSANKHHITKGIF